VHLLTNEAEREMSRISDDIFDRSYHKYQQVQSDFQKAASLFEEMEETKNIAYGVCLKRLGEIAEKNGKLNESMNYLERARNCFEEISIPDQLQEVNALARGVFCKMLSKKKFKNNEEKR